MRNAGYISSITLFRRSK